MYKLKILTTQLTYEISSPFDRLSFVYVYVNLILIKKELNMKCNRWIHSLKNFDD